MMNDRKLLDAILDQLIPANPDKGIPAAGGFGTGDFIEERAQGDVHLGKALATLLKRAGALAGGGMTSAVVRQLESERPAEFSELLALTYMGYYSRPEIPALVGVGAHPVHPQGYAVAPEPPEMIEALTAPVRARGKAYRDA